MVQEKTNSGKDLGCFIATAAYGTPMASEIQILRQFRDLKMKPNVIGKNLIFFYYDTSPSLARVIVRSNGMKAFVRTVLKPIISSISNRFEKLEGGT